MRKLYITRKLPEEVLTKLSASFSIRMWDKEDQPVPRHTLEKEVEDIDGLLCLLTDNIDSHLISKSKKLKIISNMAVGYNNIDMEAANERNIMVTNTPGVLTETTADLTFALLMATARRLVESSNYLRDGNWKTWSLMMLTGQDIFGATLGIIGLGNIGEAVARRAQGFSMKTLYYNRSRKYDVEKELNIIYTDLETLLKESDFVCVMTPYTKETEHLIGKEQLGLMKESAILINTARGGIVDEQALYEALKSKKIWGAGLDVIEKEPIDLNHSLLTLPNVILLPHIGSASVKTRTAMADIAVTNLINGLTGEGTIHLVK
ncbi:2-hydroxyacid dehydrogenase [Paenisporosarcina sp. TG-14]|uniref:2-hydroxyacid dehydrogenase n=1 Tax=Paenisporosarcina sp. TG-14 TaxID=1231057 RepID=UPI0002E0FE1E|nr:D-glycerate dehydrogenase [Paenisporosarcina sp. TG-14]